MSKHKLVHASEGSVKYDMKGLDQCEKHQKRMKFICEDHRKLCCSTCVIAGHRTCQSVADIEEKAKVELPDFQKLRMEFLDVESKATAIIKHATHTTSKLKIDFDGIFEQVQQMQDKINSMFEEMKRNLTKDFNSFQEHVRNDLNSKQASCEDTFANVKQSLSDIDDVINKGTSSQKFIMANYLTDKLTHLQEEALQNGELNDAVMTFCFVKTMPLPPAQSFIPGKLSTALVPIERETCDRAHHPKDQTVNLKLLAQIDLKQGVDDEEEPLYSGLDFLEDGRLFAVDNMNYKCLVYNMKLQALGSLQLSFKPFGVVAVSDEEIAVTSIDTIQILKVYANSEVACVRSIEGTHNYDSISMMDTENFLVGCYDDTQPIRVMTVYGEEKELAIEFPDNQYQYNIDETWCTYLRKLNKLVLIDRYAHTVYIYDLARNTRVDVKDDNNINEPCGATAGPSDCMFVCSGNTNSIIQISHEGQILSSHVLDMDYPCIVCVSKDMTKLAVANSFSGETKLHVYEIEVSSIV